MIQNRLKKSLYLPRLVLALLLPAMFTSQGCVKRHLPVAECTPQQEGGVEIDLKWDEQAAATPLSFAFYNVANGTSLYKIVDGTAQGYKGVLPIGEYKVIAYDKSALRVGYRNMDAYGTAEVYALASEASKSTGAVRDAMIAEPGAVYFASGCIEMATLTITKDQINKAEAQPQNKTRSMQLHFNITNGSSVNSINGLLDGVASSILLSTGESPSLSASISFSIERAADDSFSTSISLFNFVLAQAGASQLNTMDITLNRADNAKHNMTLDLTHTIREIIIANEGVIPIEIPIEVELDMTNLNNITATVCPWVSGGLGGGDITD